MIATARVRVVVCECLGAVHALTCSSLPGVPGTLSTTGHSTNFVMFIELPSDRRSILNNRNLVDCDVWIKAGVAAFCALRY